MYKFNYTTAANEGHVARTFSHQPKKCVATKPSILSCTVAYRQHYSHKITTHGSIQVLDSSCTRSISTQIHNPQFFYAV